MVTEQTQATRKSASRIRANARQMRHDQTDAERKFWARVRNRQLNGFKFKRQVPIGPFIADFVCVEQRLVVELDGGQHADRQSYDRNRTAFLEKHGYRVLRFWNGDVLTNMDSALDGVLLALQEKSSPSPQPLSPCGGEGE